MGLLNNLISIANAEVGYHEGYNNDNKYGAEYGFNNAAWCVIFCWWCFKHAGLGHLFPNTAHCNQVEAYAREHGRWVTAPYQVGDLVIWNYDGNWENDHIGLVVAKNGNTMITIEGNSRDGVQRNTYSNTAGIVGAYRPNYGTISEAETVEDVPDINDGDMPNSDVTSPVEEPPRIELTFPNDGAELASLQYALHAHGYTPANSRKKNGDFDGEIGAGTIEAATACAMDNGFDSYAELWQWLGGVGLG